MKGLGWTSDCMGKWGYDASLLGVDTRYWPPGHGGHPKAVARSDIRIAAEHDGSGSLTLAEIEVEGETEAQVKAAIEDWVGRQLADIRRHMEAWRPAP